MKKIFFFLWIFSTQFIQAQDENLKRANRLFERTFYADAIPLYEELQSNNRSEQVLRNLASSYFNTNQYEKASGYYRILLKNFPDACTENDTFQFTQTLKAAGNYTEANQVMQKYYSSLADSEKLNAFQKNSKMLENVAAIGARFQISNAAINTTSTEFGGFVFQDQLIYTGISASKGWMAKRFKWTGESYLDLLKTPLTNLKNGDESSPIIPNSFDSKINTKLHESNAVFTKDGNTMYFTRNNSKGRSRAKNKDKISTLQLYRASFKEGKWGNVVLLPFNNPDYSTEHPALSADEKTLYFASDRPGTLGSFDIFSVTVNGDFYGEPVNLGSNVNTNRKEQFPFISQDNKLYFSSDGHEGFGSLDVFVSNFQDGKATAAQNIGLPLNSGFDDFGFYVNSERKEGYFSSNRKGGKGGDDIYVFTEVKELIIEDCKQFIVGTITDVDTQQPLVTAVVELVDANGQVLQSITTTENGTFQFDAMCENKYQIKAQKAGYSSRANTIRTTTERKKTNDASLQLKSDEVLKREQQIAFALEEKTKLEALALEQEIMKIAQAEKAKADILALQKNKELAEQQKKEKVERILATEKEIVKDKNRLLIQTDPIYFDYNMWYIRKESKVILDKVVALMQKYPEMKVEIGSHTDTRGDKRFNSSLSEKRAQATRDYFLNKGIPKGNIFAKGYGESVPIVKCNPVESCNEEQHELNRRSEFVIKSL